MANSLKQLEKEVKDIREEISTVAGMVSRTIGDLEGKFNELGEEHLIILSKFSNLSNRVEYLENKILKK